MYRISTNAIALGFVALLAGCATTKDEVLPHGPATMLDIWNQQTGGATDGALAIRQLMDAREALRRPLPPADEATVPIDKASYTRTAGNEIKQLFHRLPNPDLVMYVFPHLTGTVPTPVPGYSTVFPFYQRVHYAMPGERTQDY
ncbi:conjugative transfer region lipoprotein [Burkholderia pseudomallei]|uniref:TIGR03751 family conjugal transfer lipoprotein n=1 Tax=Burkholderia pseudomallei TaxID=28450 RepID=UPI0005E31FD0|nr:TIGR03751 family conjugal transfer lipoprotein [Burkholderia pseudomallei]CAJ9897640.1 conjugative transfer region lipoprotein [Burkholderia pseudomallei]CFL69387.1 conjugative transfer region lipoprotein [Burkholderia pseudomallei]CFU06565.1 conjugative transfer region lipoprotein [Burkholderia pseudomallei]CPI12564.1 conjugative transfer region lipoprotein [Burkholderia pseudomallei]CPI58511.1 conjugative transfer region lipoprotein [Burkholderia pseudomallei]